MKRFIFTALLVLILITFILIAMFLGRNQKDNDPVKLADTVDSIQGLEDYKPTGELAESYGENVVYEVLDIVWNGDSGVAQVIVTTPDLSKIISDSIQSAIKDLGTADYDKLLESVKENIQTTLNSGKYPTLENNVEMDAQKTPDGYLLISNEEFEKIIAGNLEEIFIQALMEGITNESSK